MKKPRRFGSSELVIISPYGELSRRAAYASTLVYVMHTRDPQKEASFVYLLGINPVITVPLLLSRWHVSSNKLRIDNGREDPLLIHWQQLMGLVCKKQ